MTDTHLRANEWTTQVSPSRTFNLARTLRAAAIAGLELKQNQYDGLWYWQSVASTALDWRGSGYQTKTDAARSFEAGNVGI